MHFCTNGSVLLCGMDMAPGTLKEGLGSDGMTADVRLSIHKAAASAAAPPRR